MTSDKESREAFEAWMRRQPDLADVSCQEAWQAALEWQKRHEAGASITMQDLYDLGQHRAVCQQQPSEEVVERVAIAICESCGGKPYAENVIKEVTKDMLPPDGFNKDGQGYYFYWRCWARHAKAALAALQNSTAEEKKG